MAITMTTSAINDWARANISLRFISEVGMQ
jgi:hypothetical protein